VSCYFDIANASATFKGVSLKGLEGGEIIRLPFVFTRLNTSHELALLSLSPTMSRVNHKCNKQELAVEEELGWM
jgi:hypothetical protein